MRLEGMSEIQATLKRCDKNCRLQNEILWYCLQDADLGCGKLYDSESIILTVAIRGFQFALF